MFNISGRKNGQGGLPSDKSQGSEEEYPLCTLQNRKFTNSYVYVLVCLQHHGHLKNYWKSFFISLLRKLCVRIIINLDDMLLMTASQEEFLIPQDTLIFLLQHLGFLNKIKKSILTPTSTVGFLGIETDSQEMTLSLSKKKVEKLQTQCSEILDQETVTVRKLSTDSQTILHRGGCTSSTSSIPDSSISTDSGNDYAEFLRTKCETFNTGKTKAALVDTKSKPVQWQIFGNPSSTNDNQFRCIQTVFRSFISGQVYKGIMISGGEKLAYKRPGVNGNQIGHSDIYSDTEG